jgi:hypothetical protein
MVASPAPESDVFRALLLVSFGLAGITFAITGKIAAPYGRHTRGGWGPTVPARLGWFLFESVALVAFWWFYWQGPRAHELVPRVFLALWSLHYVHRAWLQPLLSRSDKRMPLLVVTSAIAFNVLNTWLNARSLTEFGPIYETSWLWSFRFLYGMLLFFTGFAVNRWADWQLARLRARSGGRYAVPSGGLFEEISCPNYFGECMMWMGWAVATWSLAGLSFALFTAANLIPRAVSHHAWYRRTFPEYPRRRKAVIPGLL